MEDDEESFFGNDDIDILDDNDEKGNKEKEGDEKSLEELASEQPQMREADIFSETQASNSKEMPTPTISSESSSQEVFLENPGETEKSLEQSASFSIADSAGFKQQPDSNSLRDEYISVYNRPEYEGSIREETVLDHMKERGMTAQTISDLSQTHRVVRWEEYPEVAESRQSSRSQGDIREYIVTEVERPDNTPKSPLERRREYRPLKRGKVEAY
jgi:hypothetical protein